ncbi:MAG TPA: YigZ family protein, partial [Epsilonproteobacteria bacterium]|nr:YigZ family protein [Campylobacterota bacterium]
LNVLRGENLVNCAVMIVRYFGGIKLGTGGMARAYALSVKNVLKVANLMVYEKESSYQFSTSYSEVDKTLYTLKQLSISQYERDFGIDSVMWEIVGSEAQIEKFKQV